MSQSYFVYFTKNNFPSLEVIEEQAQKFYSSFGFDGAYDFLSDTGYCPCKASRKKCGFEWELHKNKNKQVKADCCAELSFRSEYMDAICAVTVAAAIATLCQGRVEDVDGEGIAFESIGKWVKSEIKAYREAMKNVNQKPGINVTEQMQAWLRGLIGAKIHRVISMESYTHIGLGFSTNQGISGSRWTLTDSEGNVYSTAMLPPRAINAEQTRQLNIGLTQLLLLTGQQTIRSAQIDDVFNFCLQLENGCQLVMHARAEYQASSDIEKLFMVSDYWKFKANPQTGVCADLEEQALRYL